MEEASVHALITFIFIIYFDGVGHIVIFTIDSTASLSN